MQEVTLKPGRYSLARESDNAGDSGPAWGCYKGKESIAENEYVWVKNAAGLIKVGCGIRVGSITARSYSHQDWWQCSPVTEILEVNEDNTRVKFKTSNSVYVAKSF